MCFTSKIDIRIRACHREKNSKFEIWGVVSEYFFAIEITFRKQSLTKNAFLFLFTKDFENIQRKICQFSILAPAFKRMA